MVPVPFEDRAQALAATAGKIARLQEATFEADILQQASASLIQTGSNSDWDVTREFYTLMLEIPIPTYASIDNQREKLEKSINRRVQPLVRADAGKIVTEVVISPVLAEGARPAEPVLNQEAAQEDVPSFWQPGYFRLFISHTSANKESAHRLKQALAEYHVAAFVAHDDIEPTKEWQAEIERALRTMDAVAAIISPDFFESRWCDQEVGYAFGRGKLVVPLCKDSAPHGFLGKYQGFAAQGLSPTSVAQNLAEILIGHALTVQRMTEALVERMVSSWSWKTSKHTLALLEKVPRLNELQVAKLIQASENNVDVREAFGFPTRIQELVSRIGKASTSG